MKCLSIIRTAISVQLVQDHHSNYPSLELLAKNQHMKAQLELEAPAGDLGGSGAFGVPRLGLVIQRRSWAHFQKHWCLLKELLARRVQSFQALPALSKIPSTLEALFPSCSFRVWWKGADGP